MVSITTLVTRLAALRSDDKEFLVLVDLFTVPLHGVASLRMLLLSRKNGAVVSLGPVRDDIQCQQDGPSRGHIQKEGWGRLQIG